MTYLVFLFCFLLSLHLQSHLEAVLSMYKILILSCINSKKNGEARDSEADLPSSKLHESQNNSPNSPKLPSKGLSIICLSILCFWSLRFHHNRYVILIRKATLRWEHLEGVRKTSIWGSNIYFCAFRNWGTCLQYTQLAVAIGQEMRAKM